MKHFYEIYPTSAMWRGVVFHWSNLDGGVVKDYTTNLHEDFEKAQEDVKEWLDDNSVEAEWI